MKIALDFARQQIRIKAHAVEFLELLDRPHLLGHLFEHVDISGGVTGEVLVPPYEGFRLRRSSTQKATGTQRKEPKKTSEKNKTKVLAKPKKKQVKKKSNAVPR